MEQEQRNRGEQEARLQQISRWITDQSRWMDSAQAPSSRAELQRSIDACQVRRHICSLYEQLEHWDQNSRFQVEYFSREEDFFFTKSYISSCSLMFFGQCVRLACQDLEESIRQKSAALQELRGKRDGGDKVISCDFICQTDKSIQSCAALTQQVNVLVFLPSYRHSTSQNKL